MSDESFISFESYIEKILKARVYDVAVRTPLDRADKLSSRLGNEIFIKREDLQSVFSFKLRGAYNKIAQLTATERAKGVIAASAGNHAQGVALAAQRFSCPAVIVMPITTPSIKVEAVKSLGAEVRLHGDSYSDAEAFALDLAEKQKMIFVHPFNDPEVIAGQGTIGMELVRQWEKVPAVIFVCVGGGGLISGIGLFVKRLFPEVKIIGVECDDAPSMYEAIKADKPVALPHVGVFADGAAVKKVGDETFRIAKEVVDEIILVDSDAICAAVKDVFEETRTVLEPAGALAVAGMKAYLKTQKVRDQHFIAIASGANLNFNRLRHIAERAERGEALFAVTIPERPGSFRELCKRLEDCSVTEFNYRYAMREEAHVFIGISTNGLEQKVQIEEGLNAAGFSPLDLSSNEAAKLHIRHMVGGRSHEVDNERLFRFQFPERPGALMKFLVAMNPTWNISLFHYRNHGADVGRVLVGLQVNPQENVQLEEFLSNLGYLYFEETENPACQFFL